MHILKLAMYFENAVAVLADQRPIHRHAHPQASHSEKPIINDP